MNTKAIKVDLSTFFDDERIYSYILVDPRWESVECLQKRVELLFDISHVRFISDGCYLPPQEPIEILKFIDNIKAFVPKEFQDIKKKKKSKKSKEIILEESKDAEVALSDLNEPQEDDLHKKRKSLCLQNGSSPNIPVNNAKRLKSKSENIEMPLVLNEAKTNGEKNQNIETPLSPKEKSDTVNDEMTTTTQYANVASSTFLEDTNNVQELSKSKSPSNPFKKPKSNKSHIYFNESGEVAVRKSKQKLTAKAEKAEKETAKFLVFRCPLSEDSNGAQPPKPRIFHLKSKSAINCITKKQIIEIQEDIVMPYHQGMNGSLTDEATVVNSPEKEENKTDSFNKDTTSGSRTITKTVEEQSLSCTNGFQKEDTISTEAQKEPLETLSNLINIQSENQTGLKSASETVPLTENESQMEITEVEKNNTEPCDESQMEKLIVEENDSVLKNETSIDHTNVDETSIMSVDCVDLSNDLEDKSKDYTQEKHDLTADDESNVSSTSDVEEISEIIDLNESEDNLSSTLNDSAGQSNSPKEIKVHKILPFSFDITDLPNNNDIVVFKVAYVNNKVRSFTNFVAGRVEYVNKRTKSIKILLLDGSSELSQVPNNLFCHLDDSQECVQHLQLKFSDMVEPKLYSRT